MNGFDALEFGVLKAEIEEKTGFKCYEEQPGSQQTWYGTSAKLNAFKNLAETHIPTGTIVYCMDSKENFMWDAFNKTWY